jgi:hypothetical protein
VDLGAVFLLLAVVTLIGLFVVQPFNARARRRSVSSRALSTLLAERDRLLSALQELDFDHSLGKIPAEEYPGQRSRLMARAAEVLRQLDEIAPDRAERDPDRVRLGSPAEPAMRGAATKDADEKLEAFIARRRSAARVSDEEMEVLIARRRAARQGAALAFCPQCGKAVQPSDAFCAACGKALK